MKIVRLGIVGMGNIGRHHAAYLREGKVKRCKLTAVCSPSPAKLADFRPARIFANAREMLRSGSVDAVIIATPHFQHPRIGIAALKTGLHILVEKPIAAHKADAERLIAAHEKQDGLVFAGMFQLRAEPRYRMIRQMISSDELGAITRVNWITTDWFRSQAYYAGSAWRATWKGEGGGVLLNQCLHQLDALQWLCGMPAQVRGFCRLGQFHDIEVEDDVTAYLEYANGATGVLVTSTGEAPGTNRLEICGTLGQIVLEHDRLRITRNKVSTAEFGRTSSSSFAKPETTHEEIAIENAVAPHAQVTQNFVDAILDGAPLIAPGAEGIHSVELANAILYSSLTKRTVALPLNSGAFERKLKQLMTNSKLRRGKTSAPATDFAGSFRR